MNTELDELIIQLHWHMEHGERYLEIEKLKRFEINAKKQSMTEAAEMVSKWMESNRLHPAIPNEKLNESARVAAHSVLQQAALSILTARDNMTTI